MYAHINLAGALISQARGVILVSDRSRFDPYLRTTEQYAADRGLVVGGANSIAMLTRAPIGKDNYVYELFGENPREHAYALTKALYATENRFVDNTTMSMETLLENREFVIYADTRPIVKIFALERYRGISLVKLINPMPVDGFFHKGLKMLSGEIYLMDVYRRLYTPYADVPGGYTTFTDYLETERTVFAAVRPALEESLMLRVVSRSASSSAGGGDDTDTAADLELNEAESAVGGSADDADGGDADTGDADTGDADNRDDAASASGGGTRGGPQRGGQSPRDAEVERFAFHLLLHYKNMVVVGDYAIEHAAPSGARRSPRLEIITDTPPGELCDLWQKLLESGGLLAAGRRLTHATFNVNVLLDFRLHKHTVYVNNSGGGQTPVADVFNSTEYELVPYKTVPLGGLFAGAAFSAPGGSLSRADRASPVLAGGLFVLLRFRLVDAWTMKIINNLSPENSFLVPRIRACVGDIDRLRAAVAAAPPLEVFQLDNYAGIYANERQAKKAMLLGARVRFHPRYYPRRELRPPGPNPTSSNLSAAADGPNPTSSNLSATTGGATADAPAAADKLDEVGFGPAGSPKSAYASVDNVLPASAPDYVPTFVPNPTSSNLSGAY